MVLLSGGMDSAVAAAWTRERGYSIVALTVDYGQRSRAELVAARRIADWLEVTEHLVLAVDLRALGGSALTGDLPVPKSEPVPGTIPITYVPARNTLLLALALGLAEARGAGTLVIGANEVDYSGYPDCRPEFLAAFQRLAEVGTRAGAEGRAPEVRAPLLDLSKAEIVKEGLRLEVPFAWTLSCYDPTPAGLACGRCDSCRIRRKGFRDAGASDPTAYARS